MTDTLCTILEDFKYPLFLHGTLDANTAYPDSFFTYWNFQTPEAAFYDDEPHRAVWGYHIYFYGTDRQTVESVIEQARSALKAAGFIPQGKSIEATSNRINYTGRMITVKAFENYKK